MTEEEKRSLIEENVAELLGEFPDEMSVGMAEKIAEWNFQQRETHGTGSIKNGLISNINYLAGMWRFSYEGLISENLDEAFELLTKILGQTLARRVSQDEELKRYFCAYVYNYIALKDKQK